MNRCSSRKLPGMTKPLYEAKAEFFRTLGHPARIRVLELLCERDHAVHELLAEIDIEPSNLSHQLAVLRRTGLVDAEPPRRPGLLRHHRARDPRPPAWPRARSCSTSSTTRRGCARSCAPRDRHRIVTVAEQAGTAIAATRARRRARGPPAPGRADSAAMRRDPRRDVHRRPHRRVRRAAARARLRRRLGPRRRRRPRHRHRRRRSLAAVLRRQQPAGERAHRRDDRGAAADRRAVRHRRPCSSSASSPACSSSRSRSTGAGRYMQYIPLPVVEGFTLGIAVIIGLQQVPAALGVHRRGREGARPSRSTAVRHWFAAPQWAPVLVAASVAASMLLAVRFRPGLPVSLAGGDRRDRRRSRARPRRRDDRRDPHRPARRRAFPTCRGSALELARRPGDGRRRARRAREPALGHRRRRHERRRAPRLRPRAVRPGRRQPRRAALRRRPRDRGDRAHGGQRAQRRALAARRRSRIAGRSCSSSCSWPRRGSPTSRSRRSPACCIATVVQMVEVSNLRALMRATRGDAVVLVATALATVVFDLVTAVIVGLVVAGLYALQQVAAVGARRRDAARHRRPQRRGAGAARRARRGLPPRRAAVLRRRAPLPARARPR